MGLEWIAARNNVYYFLDEKAVIELEGTPRDANDSLVASAVDGAVQLIEGKLGVEVQDPDGSTGGKEISDMTAVDAKKTCRLLDAVVAGDGRRMEIQICLDSATRPAGCTVAFALHCMTAIFIYGLGELAGRAGSPAYTSTAWGLLAVAWLLIWGKFGLTVAGKVRDDLLRQRREDIETLKQLCEQGSDLLALPVVLDVQRLRHVVQTLLDEARATLELAERAYDPFRPKRVKRAGGGAAGGVSRQGPPGAS